MNILLNFFAIKHNKEKDSKGFSLVELVVAMSILMIIMPATVGIAKSASVYKNEILQSNKNLINSSAFDKVFRSDIENSVDIMVVENSNRIRLKKNNGTCKDWRLYNNELKYVAKTSLISSGVPTTNSWNIYWFNLIQNENESKKQQIKPGKSGQVFKYENGAVTYDISLGKDGKMENYSKSVAPKVVANGDNLKCW